MESVEFGAGFLRAFPSGGQFADARTLVRGNRVKLVFARFAASQDVSRMQVDFCATARGFAALAVHEVEAARDELCGFGDLAQKRARGAELAPELAAEVASGCGHLCVYIIIQIQIASTKTRSVAKREGNHSRGLKYVAFTAF